MSDAKMTIEETTIRVGTASEMRKRYPDEYEQFMAENPDADDRDWLNDCLAMGGPQIFDVLERDLDSWTTPVSDGGSET